MKQYKLIKEYPGSPKLDTINTQDLDYYPEFWELIVEKNYEILSFKKGCFILNVNNGRVRHEDCPNATGSEIEYVKYPIHSIKRLSDGEIFIIGDETNYGEIQGIQLDDNNEIGIKVTNLIGGWYYYDLASAKHIKKLLFITEDGVIIYDEKQKVFSVSECDWLIQNHQDYGWVNTRSVLRKYHHFSTKEKAEAYILYNEPCLNINDILKKWWLNCDIGKLETELIELVKSKS